MHNFYKSHVIVQIETNNNKYNWSMAIITETS
jgi:hypothetical protein